MSVFGEYASLYDAMYSDKDYMSETRTVDGLLKKNGNDVRSLLVFGCGTGMHDRCLRQLGYEIHGIDMSEGMIREARRASSDIEYEVGDIRSYKTESKYDAVISLFHVMSYQNTNGDIKNALRSARSALDLGGLLIFDVWYGPGVLTDRPSIRKKEVRIGSQLITRTATPTMHPNDNIVDVRYDFWIRGDLEDEIERFTEEHHMRYFFKPEMEEYLRQAGLEMVGCLDCNSFEAPGFDSWTCYFVAKAK